MGLNGWLAGEYIASGIESAARAQADLADTRRISNQIDRLVAERDKAIYTNAANFAEKHALRAALKKLSPNHPLVVNIQLQEKIKETGKKVLSITDNWDAVSEAGATFKY